MLPRKNSGPGRSNLCITVTQLSGASEKQCSLGLCGRGDWLLSRAGRLLLRSKDTDCSMQKHATKKNQFSYFARSGTIYPHNESLPAPCRFGMGKPVFN